MPLILLHPNRMAMLAGLGAALILPPLTPSSLAGGPPGAPTVGGWTTTVVPIPPPQPVRDPAWTFTLRRDRATPEPPAPGKTPVAPAARTPADAHGLVGLASYYWQPQTTASGEAFDRRGLTAAHRTLPFNTRVRVTEVRSGRSVVVRINDRGPFKPGRIIDLSEAAAEAIGMTGRGLTPVRLEVVGK